MPSNRLTTGVASMKSIRGRTPDQNSMAKKTPTNTRALPRSGCFSTSRQGTPTISTGPMRSRSERGGSFRLDRNRASISTVATLANSDGCPIWCPPTESQLWLPTAVPTPVPTASTTTSSRILKA